MSSDEDDVTNSCTKQENQNPKTIWMKKYIEKITRGGPPSVYSTDSMKSFSQIQAQ